MWYPGRLVLEQIVVRSAVVYITRHELNSALRQAGCGCLDDVQYAVLENSGAISVVPRSGNRE